MSIRQSCRRTVRAARAFSQLSQSKGDEPFSANDWLAVRSLRNFREIARVALVHFTFAASSPAQLSILTQGYGPFTISMR